VLRQGTGGALKDEYDDHEGYYNFQVIMSLSLSLSLSVCVCVCVCVCVFMGVHVRACMCLRERGGCLLVCKAFSKKS